MRKFERLLVDILIIAGILIFIAFIPYIWLRSGNFASKIVATCVACCFAIALIIIFVLKLIQKQRYCNNAKNANLPFVYLHDWHLSIPSDSARSSSTLWIDFYAQKKSTLIAFAENEKAINELSKNLTQQNEIGLYEENYKLSSELGSPVAQFLLPPEDILILLNKEIIADQATFDFLSLFIDIDKLQTKGNRLHIIE